MSILPEFSFPQFSLPDFSLSDLSITQLQMPHVTLFGVTWFYSEEEEDSASIDLGNGSFLDAPDVLDGHFRRLVQSSCVITADANMESISAEVLSFEEQAQNIAGAPVAQDDKNADLTGAVSTLAPDLAPLAYLANDLARTVPQIEPEPEFRRDLLQKLEAAHQQMREDGYTGSRCTEDGYAVVLWHYVSEHYVLTGIPVIVGLIACARYFYAKEPN